MTNVYLIHKNKLIYINQFINLAAVSRKTRKVPDYIYTLTHAYNNIVCVSQCVDSIYITTLQNYDTFMPPRFVIYHLLHHSIDAAYRLSVCIFN